jgi:hypothetical protein
MKTGTFLGLFLTLALTSAQPLHAEWVRIKGEYDYWWRDKTKRETRGRVIGADWETGVIEIRARNPQYNNYVNLRVRIADLDAESRKYALYYAPNGYVIPGLEPESSAAAPTPGPAPAPAPDTRQFEAVSLLTELPRESRGVSLTENLNGSRKISINLVDGVVTLLVNSRPAQTANIADPAYLQAVKEGKLNEFFKVDWITKDSDGNYNIPVKIESFPLLGQIGNTCWASSFREWGWHLLGKRAPYTPALADMRDFMNFISGEEDFYSTKAKEDTDKNYDREAPGRWLSLFVGAEVQEFQTVRSPAQVTELLLTGHGLIGTGQDVRQSHAFTVLGTDRDRYFVSTWEKEYFGRGRLIPYPVEWVTIITPKRNEKGAVMVPVAPQPRDGREAKLLTKLEKKMEAGK